MMRLTNFRTVGRILMARCPRPAGLGIATWTLKLHAGGRRLVDSARCAHEAVVDVGWLLAEQELLLGRLRGDSERRSAR